MKERLSKHEATKNSNNSSIPPSQDENRPTRQSLREKSGRKPGCQQGHKGITLQLIDNPDKTEVLVSDYCQCCGNDLHDVTEKFVSRRQVVDLPVIKPIYTEYQYYSRKCSCGHEQVSNYPSHVTNHIQYDSVVEAAVGYYSVYQYLPYKRMSELFLHLYNLPISQGSIGNLLTRLGERVQLVYDSLQNAIATSRTALVSYETGAKVNGKKIWAWIWQTVTLTYSAISESRSKKSLIC